jgi:hypothetical protein
LPSSEERRGGGRGSDFHLANDDHNEGEKIIIIIKRTYAGNVNFTITKLVNWKKRQPI